MRVFCGQLLKIFIWPRRISSRCLTGYSSMCSGRLITDKFCGQIAVSRAGRCQLSAVVCTCQQPSRSYSSLHRTQCDVHKFGELRLAVGSSCDVTVSSLDPHVYLEQNLVIVDDSARRLSVDCRNADGVSRVSLSESTEMKTSKHGGLQQLDTCDVQVPIKYGTGSFFLCAKTICSFFSENCMLINIFKCRTVL